jgi:hypothetical protein
MEPSPQALLHLLVSDHMASGYVLLGHIHCPLEFEAVHSVLERFVVLGRHDHGYPTIVRRQDNGPAGFLNVAHDLSALRLQVRHGRRSWLASS